MILKGKNIIVTGSEGLLGTAIARDIISEGGTAIGLDISTKSSRTANKYKVDVTKPNQIEKTLNKIFNNYRRIDGLVNNAYPKTSDWNNDFEKINYKSWSKNIEWQLNSIFKICQHVIPIMTKQGNGSIVNMGSVYGVTAPDFKIYEETNITMPAAYSAIKGGLIQFSKYLAAYFGKNGVRVNLVSPGGVINGQHKKFIERYEQKVPLGRMAIPGDIASSVSFLLSDRSSYITGQNLIVDGGFTLN